MQCYYRFYVTMFIDMTLLYSKTALTLPRSRRIIMFFLFLVPNLNRETTRNNLKASLRFLKTSLTHSNAIILHQRQFSYPCNVFRVIGPKTLQSYRPLKLPNRSLISFLEESLKSFKTLLTSAQPL